MKEIMKDMSRKIMIVITGGKNGYTKIYIEKEIWKISYKRKQQQ